VESVEFAKVQVSVFDQLKKGANVLKAMQAEMSVDAVEELMADTQEALDYQKEVDALISQNLSAEDEQDVLDELESLSSEITEADVKPRQPAKVVAAAGSKQPARVESIVAESVAEPPRAPASPVDESAISADDLKELEELEGIMGVPSAPTHAVTIPESEAQSTAPRGKQRQLVSE
jgi:charged multivesicular body protein 6